MAGEVSPRTEWDVQGLEDISAANANEIVQVDLSQILQFDVMYGNTDVAALGGYGPSTLDPQKLGVLEQNSVGLAGLGGCDGRDEFGLYVLTDEPAPPGLPPAQPKPSQPPLPPPIISPPHVPPRAPPPPLLPASCGEAQCFTSKLTSLDLS